MMREPIKKKICELSGIVPRQTSTVNMSTNEWLFSVEITLEMLVRAMWAINKNKSSYEIMADKYGYCVAWKVGGKPNSESFFHRGKDEQQALSKAIEYVVGNM